MAAWTARIEVVGGQGDGASLSIAVDYFLTTDTQFTTILATNQFTAAADTSASDLRTQIVAYGQTARNTLAKIAAAQALVGTTVSVP